MSGGHWNYGQRDLASLASALQEEGDPVLIALGRHLDAIADQLEVVDRIYSGDRGHDELPAALAALRKLMTPGAGAEVARELAENAVARLKREITAEALAAEGLR